MTVTSGECKAVVVIDLDVRFTTTTTNSFLNAMQSVLRVARPASLAIRAARSSSVRTIATSAARRSEDHLAFAPTLFGPGAKKGEVATAENQSTGLDRVESLGLLQGVEVWDQNPLDSSRIGTKKDPIKVISYVRPVYLLHLPHFSYTSSYQRLFLESPSDSYIYRLTSCVSSLVPRAYHWLHRKPCRLARYSMDGPQQGQNPSLP